MKQYILFADNSKYPAAQFRAASDEEAVDHVHENIPTEADLQYDLYRQIGGDSSKWPWVSTFFTVSAQPQPQS